MSFQRPRVLDHRCDVLSFGTCRLEDRCDLSGVVLRRSVGDETTGVSPTEVYGPTTRVGTSTCDEDSSRPKPVPFEESLSPVPLIGWCRKTSVLTLIKNTFTLRWRVLMSSKKRREETGDGHQGLRTRSGLRVTGVRLGSVRSKGHRSSSRVGPTSLVPYVEYSLVGVRVWVSPLLCGVRLSMSVDPRPTCP